MIKTNALPDFSSSFLKKFSSMCSFDQTENNNPRQGRKPLLQVSEIVSGLAWHIIQPAGTFANNLAMVTGQLLSEAALSERRQSLGRIPWTEALSTILKPVADKTLHPHAFYKGMRAVGVDGTTFNVSNTPAMKLGSKKSKTRRGRAAFSRINCVALVELCTHAPLAVRIAENEESEAVLAAEAIHDLKDNDLLIADRYYGSGKWAARFLALNKDVYFLVRVQERFGACTVRKLGDGSSIVKVKDPDSGNLIILREIKGKVRRPGKPWTLVRFWTNLLDHRLYPAQELLELYGLRWEHEIAFREIKTYLQEDNLLLSHTKVTAAQEICSLFIAQAVIASIRSKTADNLGVNVLLVSFGKTLQACRNLGWLLSIVGNMVPRALLQQIVIGMEQQLLNQLSKKRRKRSCPRKVRQPINKWSRLLNNEYDKGKFQYEIRKS